MLTADKYMDSAETLLRECAETNPELRVWRCMWPIPHDDEGRKIDTILVGMSDENEPEKPSKLIVLSTYLDLDKSGVEIETESMTQWPPFGGGHDPFENLKKEAVKLSAL